MKPGSPHEVSLALHPDFLCRQDRTEITQFRTSALLAREEGPSGLPSAFVTHRRRTEPDRVAMLTFDGVGLLNVTGSLEVFEAAIASPGPFDFRRCGTDERSTVRCSFGVMLCQGRGVMSVLCCTDVGSASICGGRAARRLKTFSYTMVEAYALVRHATTRGVRVTATIVGRRTREPAGSHVG
jgi:hypothetical protein